MEDFKDRIKYEVRKSKSEENSDKRNFLDSIGVAESEMAKGAYEEADRRLAREKDNELKRLYLKYIKIMDNDIRKKYLIEMKNVYDILDTYGIDAIKEGKVWFESEYAKYFGRDVGEK